jgi:hypothetical protein
MDLTAFDEVVVERLVRNGTKQRPWDVGTPNLVEATRLLAGKRYSDGQIAFWLNTTRRQVMRWRSYVGTPAPLPADGSRGLIRHDMPTAPQVRKIGRSRDRRKSRAQVEESRVRSERWAYPFSVHER